MSEEEMKKITILVVSIAMAILVTIILCSSIVITQKDEYTVVKKFGKIERVISEPGISFKVPILEDTHSVSKTLLIYDIPESEVITKDKKNMVVDCYVCWKITDPEKFAKSLNLSESSAKARINNIVFNAIKNTISSIEQNEVISGRDTELTNVIMNYISDSMNSEDSKGYGFEITDVKIKKLDLPSDNKAAVYERMISERAEIAAKYTAEGDSESQKLKNETDKTIEINLSNAKTQAEEIIAEGEKEYMRILNDAYSDTDKKEFYNFQLELNSLKNYMTGDKTLFLPKDSPLAKMFISGYEK